MSVTVTTSKSQIQMISTSGPDRHRELISHIVYFLRDELDAEPVAMIRAWLSARECLGLLSENGYRGLARSIAIVDGLLCEARRAARRALIKQILQSKVSDAQTDAIIEALAASAAEAETLADIDAVEKELCA